MTRCPRELGTTGVVSMLENAKQWLATAVETTGPAEIAAAKAQIVTAETYARELHLSKDIRQDAQEMVRRAEYALGRAIRKAQEEGTVAAENKAYGRRSVPSTPLASPTDFAADVELYDRPSQGMTMPAGVERLQRASGRV